MRRFEFCWPGVEQLAWIVVYPEQYFENMAHFGTIFVDQCVTVRTQLGCRTDETGIIRPESDQMLKLTLVINLKNSCSM